MNSQGQETGVFALSGLFEDSIDSVSHSYEVQEPLYVILLFCYSGDRPSMTLPTIQFHF
jgi:hypothetical protein